MKKNIKELTIEFPEKLRVEINDYKATRKIMEMADENLIIVSDGVYIYGISQMNEMIENNATIVTVNGYYSISLKIDDKNIDFKYGNIINISKVNENTTDKAIESIEILFTSLSDGQKEKIANVIEKIKQQEKGSMLIISNNAVYEADRLKYQSTLISPKEITDDIIKSISKIDGSVIIDENATCHAIGVIVDGVACKFGDKSRGARFNSAIKYISEQREKAVAIVVSEDKMIDKKRIERLESESKTIELFDERKNIAYNHEISNADLQYSKTITENDLEDDVSILMTTTDDCVDISSKGVTYFKLKLPKKSTKHLEESINILESKETIFEEEGWRYYYLGINYMYLNQLTKSVENFKEAIKIDKNEQNFKLQLAMAYMKQDELNLGKDILEELVKINREIGYKTHFSMLLYNLGVAYYRLGEFEKCRDCMEEAIDVNDKNSRMYFYLGCANVKLKNFDKAKNNYINAINLNDNDSRYYFGLGQAYYENNEFNDSIKYYEASCKINPDEIMAHIQLSNIYINYQKDLLNASKHLEEVIRLDESNIDTMNRLGSIYIELEEYKNAENCYLKAIKLNSSAANLFSNLGTVYNKMYMFKESFSSYKKAIELEGENPLFYYNLSTAYIDAYSYNALIKSKKIKNYLINSKVCAQKAIDLSEEGSYLYRYVKERLAEINMEL
ncbi:MAG: tetratricopeptide repeat protein [Paeniclostridium sordellii]|nr:tetratricopeptide repeat protein [Paeniclostridium sordellii]